MARITKPAPEVTAEEQPELLPAREVDLRRAVRLGLLSGLTATFITAIGMVQSFAGRAFIDQLTLGYALLFLVPLVFGYMAGQSPAQLEGYVIARRGVRNVVAGVIVGVLTGVVLAAFTALAGTINLRRVLINVSPQMVELLTFERGLLTGALVLIAIMTVIATASAALQVLPDRWRKPVVMGVAWVLLFGMLSGLVVQLIRGLEAQVANPLGLTILWLNTFLYQPGGAMTIPAAVLIAVGVFALYARPRRRKGRLRERLDRLPRQQRRGANMLILIVLLGILAILPNVLGPFMSEVANTAGIFMLMALGLNIVVGFAGLLDLGYVAFFAVGAYTAAVLTSPISPAVTPELVLWTALPFIILAAAAAGLMVGTPVLRMRGDYLAIVTLGFGEIARLLLVSDWLTPVFGGAQGIRQIPSVTIGPLELNAPQEVFYPIFFFVIVAAYMSYALHDARIGRAWMALREDESVAEAMGVNIVTAKLWAFVMGAILASFGGALFGAKVHSVFPHSFNVEVSILILVIIIVGGIESMPGVMLGALLLVGIPNLLREFEDFRFLLYGALLIIMMLNRPEGFVPSKRRSRELHEEEVFQDAWLKQEREREEQEEPDAPPTPRG